MRGNFLDRIHTSISGVKTCCALSLATISLVLSACNGSNSATSPATFPAPATPSYTLSVSKTGAGAIISVPTGIDCGSVCSASYRSGTNINLSATPAAGYSFASWGGACSGSGACSVSMTMVRTVTATFSSSVTGAGPVVLYTDITSGPNSGGENNNGAYLTLFGHGFGATQGSSVVTINGVAVVAYKRWSDSQITVQPGAAISSGAIQVTVAGLGSNTDRSFTVRPGKIFFVALTADGGNDSTGIIGDITHPFRSAQGVFDRSDFGAGDHIVLRGGTWTDTNTRYDSFFSMQDGKGGTATDPIVLMGYPGETVLINRGGAARGIHAWNSPGGLTVANLHINMNGGGSCIGWPPGVASSFGNTMQNMRIVNNEMYGMSEYSGGSACVEGRGRHMRVLGNVIHDNAGSKLYHGVYFDNNDTTGTDDIEIAYNTIYNQKGGRGIQIYNAGTSGISNVSVHHNLIHDIALDGILFGDSTQGGMLAYDNVVYRTAVPALQYDGTGGGCIRFNNVNLSAQVYNNTFSDCAVDNLSDSGALRLDAAKQITLVNNILASTGGSGYYTGNPSGMLAASSNNLWYGSGAAPAWDSNAVAADPLFVNAPANFRLQTTSPARDKGSATVNSVVTIDFEGNPRPQGPLFDIGAFELPP